MRKIRFIARKEFYHILRDPRSLAIALAMPLIMTFLYGYAVNMDIREIALAVVDHDNTETSRRLASKCYESGYFVRPQADPDLIDPETLFRRGAADAVMVLRPGLAKALERQETYEIGLLVDGSDNNFASAAQSYLDQVVAVFAREQLPPGVEMPGIRLAVQVRYNPDLQSSHFFVPALAAIIMLMISALLTSITIARERETGTMEQLLTTPVTPMQILIGKTLPYVALALLDGILVILGARIVFSVPFAGSYLLLLLLGLLYIITSLAMGIMISSLVSTQQVAMMFTVILTLLPSVMLSGFIFAIKNMPLVIRPLSHILPAYYFVTIVRGIMLKGADLTVLGPHALALVALMLVMFTVAIRVFRMRVG